MVAVDPSPPGVRTFDLQAALDRAARRGEGTVLLPPGRYRTGTLVLGRSVILHLAAGALLEGLAEPSAYPVDAGHRESGPDESLAPDGATSAAR